MKVIVSGGAGYIGAHVVRLLDEKGYSPIILDDFRASSRARTGKYSVENVSLENVTEVFAVFEKYRPEAVIHLGGYISVGESTKDPDRYWNNNLGASMSLILACARYPIHSFVYSSTAAVYGNATTIPIPETVALRPTSPYGASKLGFESVLHPSACALGFRSVALRYFNASGTNVDWGIGEQHDPEEHLIPRAIRALRAGVPVQIYGNGYPTPDGTCVRDYIHVMDLAEAHIKVLECSDLEGQHSFNVGTGNGHSVLQVVNAIAVHLAVFPKTEILDRRLGDPPQLVADPTSLIEKVGWKPNYSSLDEIVQSAVKWEMLLHP